MKPYKERILIIDGETNTRQILKAKLDLLGFNVFLSKDGEEGLCSFKQDQPDFVILDILLPKLNGYKVCEEIRKDSNVPIVILTALNDVSAQITALKLGADDYIIKPFSLNLLKARIYSLLRRSKIQSYQAPPEKKDLIFGQLTINTTKLYVLKRDKKVKLTEIEFNLLKFLIENAGNVISRRDILNEIWGYSLEEYSLTRVVDVYIFRIRSKLEENPRNPSYILTIRGVGYMFQAS